MGDRWRVAARAFVALLSAMVLFVTGYGWRAYHTLSTGLTQSHALSGLPMPIHGPTSSIQGSTSSVADTNILIMGLDSRRDQNGNPLPEDVLAQLHAGDSDNGGYNTNVLMLVHVPGNGGNAEAISIPRDDYVELPDSPDNISKEKIKEAYGLAKDDKERVLRGHGVTDHAQLEQAGREAGRRQTIRTVQQFLGGVPIDHFVEVTLVGFYDLATALGSVMVCLRGPTQDSYSGAKFHAGYQQLNASQALAFVRQRRDYVHPDLNFTDLDRERRQQAFLASAAFQLRSLGTFADPVKLANLIGVATRDIVIDSGFELLGFLRQSTGLLRGDITFTTLPVTKFGKKDGHDVNFVDLDQIQTMVHNILDPDHPAPAGSPSPLTPPPLTPSPLTSLPVATLDVVNAAGHTGIAATLQAALVARGLIKGSVITKRTLTHHTMLTYAPDVADSATALAGLLGQITSTPDPDLRSGHERLVIGTDLHIPAALTGTDPGQTSDADVENPETGTAPPPASPATSISGNAIPCVT